MHQSNRSSTTMPVPGCDVLTELLRDGAQRMLARAIDAEVHEWIERHAAAKDERGRQLVVRNGHHPKRTLVTGVGPVEVTQPRVLDRRIAGTNDAGESIDGKGRVVERFRSSILPTGRSSPSTCVGTDEEEKPAAPAAMASRTSPRISAISSLRASRSDPAAPITYLRRLEWLT